MRRDMGASVVKNILRVYDHITVLHRDKERNILHTIREDNLLGHILRRNYFLKKNSENTTDGKKRKKT